MSFLEWTPSYFEHFELNIGVFNPGRFHCTLHISCQDATTKISKDTPHKTFNSMSLIQCSIVHNPIITNCLFYYTHGITQHICFLVFTIFFLSLVQFIVVTLHINCQYAKKIINDSHPNIKILIQVWNLMQICNLRN